MDNIPDSVVGFLLNNLTELVKYNVGLISGVKESVNNLWNELEALKAFARQCTEEYEDNNYLEGLANEIRAVVFEAEDAIETYVVETQRQKLRKPVDKTFHAIDHKLVLRGIARNIEDITKKVRNLHQSRMPFGLKIMKLEKIATAGESRKEKFPVDDDMVGFEDEAKTIIELLSKGPQDLEVISIIGMLGLGKTTLARKVFNHPTIEYRFFIRAFVQVSQDYRVKDVFLKILRTFTQVSDEMYRMSDDELAEIIREHLEKRQYLIVLDDVWDRRAWNDLKIAFPKNEKGSRILITSRHGPVALHANPKSEPHYLRFLYPEESEELLRKKVFGENSCPPQFSLYEAKILRRCKGLPLAIVVVAGILLNNRDKPYWWKNVSDGVANYDPELKEQSDEVIKLSYDHLPYRLKPCFLYIGIFREDFEIPARTLSQLWVSEGFIQVNGDRTMEDAAAEYLEELVGRSLVMVVKRRPNGQIKTCRIHDTLRDFCKEKAEKENLFREIKRYEQATNSFGSISTDTDRRICINSYVEQYIKLKRPAKHVRSFLSFAKEETTLEREDISSIPKAFKLLRVLDMRSIKLVLFPSELYYLVLLKYVAISCDLKIIPEKMSNLCNLQTLIVRTSSRTLEVKCDIWKMPQFRHLDTNSCTSLAEVREESNSENVNLQTLSTISPESCRKEVFDRTPRLKKLGIKGKLSPYFEANGQSSLFNTFQKLELLENLKLLNDDSSEKLKALPDHKNFPSNLTRLTLFNTLLGWEHMSTLAKLKKLEVLKLEDNAFMGESWETEDGGFVGLKVFHIGKTDLGYWRASASNFPVLSHLYLRHCTELFSMPPDFVHIQSLQMIDLYCTNTMVASSTRKLQLAKLQVQAQEKDKKTAGFKVSVYPPDQ